MRNSHFRIFIGNNGVPVSVLHENGSFSPTADSSCSCGNCSCHHRPHPPFPPYPPFPPFPPLPPYPPFPPFPPVPVVYPYTVNYYANSIDPANILGSISGEGYLGQPIAVDLTLFAPAGYQTPGVRSGAEFISAVPGNNVVNVVYSPMMLNWQINYYAGAVDPANLLGTTAMPPVPYGTEITLTPLQLDAFLPATGYDNGVQVGGPTAIVVNGQVISVLYPAL